MKPSIKYIYFLLLAFITCANAFAQKFTAQLSATTVEMGQRFSITYSIENRSIDELILPTISAFSIVGGPHNGTSTLIVNGRKTQSSSITYDFVCKKTGKFGIPSATLKSNGKDYRCNTLTLEVVKAGKNKAKQPQNTRQDPFGMFGSVDPVQYEEPVSVTNKDIFVTLNVSDSKIYVGQPFTIDFRIYSRFQPIGFDVFEMPEFKDAWQQEVELEGDTAYSLKVVNGRQYNSAVLKRALYIPHFAGKYTLNPVKLGVHLRFAQRQGKLWADYFNGGMIREERYNIVSNSASLQILDFPEKNKPTSFKGATGNFKMSVSTDMDSVNVNEPFTISIAVNGSGNLNFLKAPEIKSLDGFEILPPKSSDNIVAKKDSLKGSRTFEYIVIPHKTGKFVLPPIEFSYFNPKTEKYNTLISDSISIYVVQGNQAVEIANELRPMKKISESVTIFSDFFHGVIFFTVFILLLISTVVLWFLRTKIWDMQNDGDRKRLRDANGSAIKRLKKASELLSAGNTRAFYEECHKAILHYLQDKKGLPLIASAPPKVKQFLEVNNTSESLAEEAKQILDACEFARFAPAGNASELQNFEQRCIRFISNMEEKK